MYQCLESYTKKNFRVYVCQARDQVMDIVHFVWKQERYELQMQLNRYQALARETEVDLENFQASQKQKEKQAAQQLTQLLEQHSQEIAEWSQKVEDLEEIIESMKQDHSKEISQLKQKLSIQEKEIKNNNDLALELKVEELNVENEALKVSLSKKEEEFNALMQENLRQCKLYQELTENHSELQCLLNSKKEQLESTSHCLSELREENALLRQANMVQNAPQHSTKGNSLFAEVEDNRQALKNNLDAVMLKYKRLKKSFEGKCLEVSKVLGEKAALCRQLENVDRDQESFHTQLISSYQVRIKDLENTVNKLKEANKDNGIKISNDFDSCKLVECMLESSRKKVETLEEQLEARSLNHMLQSELLHKTQRELQVAKAQALKAKTELEFFKSGMTKDSSQEANFEENAIKPQTPPLKENKPPKSIKFADDVSSPSSKQPLRVSIREISGPQRFIPSANKSFR